MQRSESDFASPGTFKVGQHLGGLVRQARLARNWTRQELAERSRVSLATVARIEKGSLSASLGAWLSVLELLGLLPLLSGLRDPSSEALLDATRAKRARRKQSNKDLDF